MQWAKRLAPSRQSFGARVLSLRNLLSPVIAAGLIILLATQFDLDWQETWLNIRSMNPWLYLLALALYYISFVFRGVRWRILAVNASNHENDVDIPSYLHMSQLIVIGWFFNSILWLRMGDLYRAQAFATDSKSSFSWSLGTLTAERVMDMVTVAVIISVSVAALKLTPAGSAPVNGFIIGSAIVMAAGLLAAVIAIRIYGLWIRRYVPVRFHDIYDRFYGGVIDSFGQTRSIFMLSLLGAIGWLLEIGRLYFVVRALGIDIDPILAAVVALGHAILSTVPTPGGVGAVEPGVTGLLLVELSRPDAVAVTIVDRSITYLSIIVIGGLLFAVRQLGRFRKSRISARLRAHPTANE